MKSAQDKAFRAMDRMTSRDLANSILANAFPPHFDDAERSIDARPHLQALANNEAALDIAADRLLDDIIPQVPATCAAQHRMDDLGVCRLCGKPMRRGQRLYHDEYSSDDKARVHGSCADEKAEARR